MGTEGAAVGDALGVVGDKVGSEGAAVGDEVGDDGTLPDVINSLEFLNIEINT